MEFCQSGKVGTLLLTMSVFFMNPIARCKQDPGAVWNAGSLIGYSYRCCVWLSSFSSEKMEHFCQRQDHIILEQKRQKLQNEFQHRLLNQKLTNTLEIHYNPIRTPTSFLLYFADRRRAWTDYFAQCTCPQCFARGSPGGVASRCDLQPTVRSVQRNLFCTVTSLSDLQPTVQSVQ